MNINKSLLNELPSTQNTHLALMRAALADSPYEGYPAQADRFFANHPQPLTVPEAGSWTVNTHPNRKDIETTPSVERQLGLLTQGYRLDTLGRPLHPWYEAMASDQAIGLVGGKGALWQWGPNKTADALVVHDNHLLLVQREDTGLWAVPGGFIDGNEPASTAALRELREETGLELADDTYHARIVYDGPVADPRLTAHAWPETTAIVHHLDSSTQPEVHAQDDAAVAEWVPFHEVLDRPMFGSHRWLASLAIQQFAIQE